WLRINTLYRHWCPGALQYPEVSPKAIRIWREPLSHMIPRSVPETAKRSSVLFGLFGPVTQPTSDVPGGSAGGGAGAGAGAASGIGWASVGCWTGGAGGAGGGATPACFC